jgi:general secretion pathway protein F
MRRYTAKVSDSAGRVSTVDVQATARETAVSLLLGRGMFPVEVSEQRSWARMRSRMSPAQAALGLRVLSRLVESGLPLLKALHAMEEVAPGPWRAALPLIRERVRQGGMLSDGLDASGVALPDTIMGAIRAGESGADAGAAIDRAAVLMESRASARSALIGALAYPALLTLASVVSVGILVGVVLPRFERILTELGEPLPLTLGRLLAAAEFFRVAAAPVGVLAVAGVISWRIWTSTASGRERWHEWLLNLPGIGAYRLCVATARLAEAMAALLRSGVSASAALRDAAPAAGDAAIHRRLLQSRRYLNEGQAISAALAATRAVTPTALFFVAAAEETGNLGDMLAQAGEIEAERSERMIRSAVRLAEPLLIMLLAAVITLVAAALLQALYSIQPSV